MGKIGQFIDRMCEEHPDVMQKVLESPMASMRHWLLPHPDGRDGLSGCLLGEIAIAAGLGAKFMLTGTGNQSNLRVLDRVIGLTGFSHGVLNTIASRVTHLAMRPLYREQRNTLRMGSDVFSMPALVAMVDDDRLRHWMRQRIARSLVIRQSRSVPAAPKRRLEPDIDKAFAGACTYLVTANVLDDIAADLLWKQLHETPSPFLAAFAGAST